VKEKLHIIKEFIFICKRKGRFKDQCSLEHGNLLTGGAAANIFAAPNLISISFLYNV